MFARYGRDVLQRVNREDTESTCPDGVATFLIACTASPKRLVPNCADAFQRFFDGGRNGQRQADATMPYPAFISRSHGVGLELGTAIEKALKRLAKPLCADPARRSR